MKTKDKRQRRQNPVKLSRIERNYAAQLKQVARMVGSIVDNGYDPLMSSSVGRVESALKLYSDALKDWAKGVASKMLLEVAGADEKAWRERAAMISRAMGIELKSAPTGQLYHQLMEAQVDLITSLPLEAGQRVHKLASQAMLESSRADQLAKEIYRTGEVTESRAMLIARTETSRAASTFTEARAKYAGSTHYIWRTSGDSDVRHDHKELEGKVIAWDSPPIADQRSGTRAHAGALWNCRCWSEVILPED